ncbi:lysosomal acid lipase/cholesteryl ester hydrolase-like [Vipera latastei]
MWLFLVMACLILQTENSEGSVRHLNPQEFMTIPQIIQYWGYSSEEYEVLTDDGYYLTLNRILSRRLFLHLTGLIAFSLLPQLAQKVKLFLCFTPVYTLRGITGLPKALGKIPPGLRKSRADVYVGIFPDFTSVKTVSHWGQVIYSKELKYFDHGKKNKAVYNRTTAPFYKIEDVTIPVAVWSGGRDIIATKKDVELLTSRITHLVFYKNIPYWQHMDPILGLDSPQQLYNDIRKLMQKY